ncbi:MAG: hypothetical protein HFH57_02865 [Lachnospiraceae bacterium]|nr:hypothetical protein [Lachnospiraceae bacterium]
MKPQFTKSTGFKLGFKLNMQIIADALEETFSQMELYDTENTCRLEGVKIFSAKSSLKKNYVYLISSCSVDEKFSDYREIPFIIVGRADACLFPENSPILQIIDGTDFLEIFDLIQEIFEIYKKWDWKLQEALNSQKPLDEILLASMEVFRNPMFIHDANFFILSCPKHPQRMLYWETDPRTGRKMVPMSTINDFKLDKEYLEGLGKKEPVIFSAYQRGYRILFVNLWCNGKYEGRILVDEIQNPIRPGDLYVIEYLGKLIEMCIQSKELFWLSMDNEMEQFFLNFLSEKIQDEQQIINYLHLLRWNLNDRYLCLRIITEQKDFSLVSSTATLGQIDAQIFSGHTFLYDNSIVVIVNLSYENTTPQKVLRELAIILREGLLKIGVSSEVNSFMLIPKAYHQARIALELGRISDSMYWYYYFEDYMLEYMINCASKDVPIQLLCMSSLQKLRKYDKENNTELYRTLLVFLRLERNFLQTSTKLFIHRSTLSYRLKRIQKITGVDLDNPSERLRLLISFYMLEGSSLECV